MTRRHEGMGDEGMRRRVDKAARERREQVIKHHQAKNKAYKV